MRAFAQDLSITSLTTGAKEFGKAVRNHWSIENNLHWTLDIHFKDDHDYKREKNSAINFGIIKRMGLSLIKKEPSKGTINRVGRGSEGYETPRS